jgi:hypothetical protein
MWTPQIIYNIINYNKYIYPFFYFIIASIERLFFGFYFRAYNQNFFSIKGDKIIIYILIIYFIINYIILFLQSFKGPRFFLSKKYIKEDFDFYKTKDELLEFSSNISNLECVICLQPIFCDDDETDDNNGKEKNNDDNNNNINTDCNLSINEMSINDLNKEKKNMEINNLKQKKVNMSTKVKKKGKKFWNNFCYNLKEIINILFLEGFFKFYRISKNPQNKKYMKTPCNHAFHSLCLEKWLVRKKECPNCRHDLTGLIS